MANDESALREVDQELAEERQWQRIRKHGPILGAAALAMVAAVAGIQFMSAQKQRTAEKSAIAFHRVVGELKESPEAGRVSLDTFAAEAPPGYAVLAEFRKAASLAQGSERLAARDLYRKIYGETSTPVRLAQLARLRAATLSLEDGKSEVSRDIESLEGENSPIGFHARELSGIAALNAKEYTAAKNIFDRAIINPDAPESIRRRAEELSALAASGLAGAQLTIDLQVNDLAKTLDNAGTDGALEDSHAGHDHTDGTHEEPMLGEDTSTPEDENSELVEND